MLLSHLSNTASAINKAIQGITNTPELFFMSIRASSEQDNIWLIHIHNIFYFIQSRRQFRVTRTERQVPVVPVFILIVPSVCCSDNVTLHGMITHTEWIDTRAMDTQGRNVSTRKQVLNSISSVDIPVNIQRLETSFTQLKRSPCHVIEHAKAFRVVIRRMVLSALRIEPNVDIASNHILNKASSTRKHL